MDLPPRKSLAERAQATLDRLRGDAAPIHEAPAPDLPDEHGPSRLEAALKEAESSRAAEGPGRPTGEVPYGEHVTPTHTPEHAPQNASQWRAKLDAEMQQSAPPEAEKDRRAPEQATRPAAPIADKAMEHADREMELDR